MISFKIDFPEETFMMELHSLFSEVHDHADNAIDRQRLYRILRCMIDDKEQLHIHTVSDLIHCDTKSVTKRMLSCLNVSKNGLEADLMWLKEVAASVVGDDDDDTSIHACMDAHNRIDKLISQLKTLSILLIAAILVIFIQLTIHLNPRQ